MYFQGTQMTLLAYAQAGRMPERELNVDSIIDGRPIGALQWRVVVICFLLAVIDGFDAAGIGYVAPLLTEQFTIPPELMGQLLSAALVGLYP